MSRVVAGVCRQLRLLKILYRTDVPVSPARKRFDVARAIGRVAKHFANPRNRVVQVVVKIAECVTGPDSSLKFFASHNLARPFQQDFENLEGLSAQAQSYAVLAQFASTDIQLISVEP